MSRAAPALPPVPEERLLALLDAAADAAFDQIVGAWSRSLRAARRGRSTDRLRSAIEARSVPRVLEAIGWDDLERALARRGKGEMLDALDQLFRVGADVGQQMMPAQPGSGRIPRPLSQVEMRKLAADWLRDYGARRVRGLTRAARRSVRAFLVEGWKGRDPLAPTVKLVEGVIGLDHRQARALARFARQQRDEVLSRGRRRTSAQVKTKVEARRKKMLHERAVRITRTEQYNAMSQGQRRYWRQMVSRGDLDAGGYVVEWVARPRGAQPPVCRHCRALDGKRVPIVGGMFVSARYGRVSGPTLHTRCLCGLRLIPVDFPEIELPVAA